MKKSPEYIYAYENDLIRKDTERDKLFDYIDKMAHIDWDFPKAFKDARPDVRTIRDSTPAEAVESASIALSNQRPIWTVPPYGSNIKEYERANNIEYLIDCNFAKSNTRGTGTVLFDKARSAILYNMIATRTDDLASLLPKSRKAWTNLQRNAWAQGRFLHRSFKPKTIHYEISDMGLVAVLNCRIIRAPDMMKYWELYANDSMVKGALKQMQDYVDSQRASQGSAFNINSLWFAFYDYIDHDQVLRHGHFLPNQRDFNNLLYTGNITAAENHVNDIIFADSENEHGFINWSIRVGGNRLEEDPKYALSPMLAQLYYSNVWETVNIIQSIVLSRPISELEAATEAQYTTDGQPLPENDGKLIGRQGDRVERLQFPMQDPLSVQVMDRLLQSIVRNTGASALGDINTAKGTPYATLNAVLQVIMGKLDIQRRDIGLSCVDDAKNDLKWVEYNKVPMMAYRQSDASVAGRDRMMGDQVVITADDFDAYEFELDCDIRPKTPTDFQQQVLTAIQLHDKSPLPWKELLQNLGFKNVDLLKTQRISEDFTDAEIQAALQSIMAKQQMKDQMQAQSMMQGANMPGGGQQPVTSPPNPGGGLSETAFGGLGPGMPMNNPAGGGMSTSNMMPGLTRETVSGLDRSGGAVR